MENYKSIISAVISGSAAAVSFIETYTDWGRAVAVTVSIIAGLYSIYINYKKHHGK